MIPAEQRIAKVMAETGMGRMQAINRLRQEDWIRSNPRPKWPELPSRVELIAYLLEGIAKLPADSTKISTIMARSKALANVRFLESDVPCSLNVITTIKVNADWLHDFAGRIERIAA